VNVNVFLGAGADYTKPKARRAAGQGKKKQQGFFFHGRMKVMEERFCFSCFLFVSFVWG
jgi:hypothetical protein